MKRVRVRTVIIVVATLSLLLLAGAYSVNAATTGTQKFPPIVEKLVKEFNLDRNKVDKVLGEYRQEREAERKAHIEERLDQAVKNKEITQAQKDAILKKMDEIKAKIEGIMSQELSFEERRAAMEKLRADVEAWAKENGLDKKFYLFGRGFMGGKGGFKHGRGGGFMGGPGWFRGGCPGGFAPDSNTNTATGGI